MSSATRIAVIGAGLGGLTAAAYLQRAGFAVTVYEQTDSFSRIGAGIILGANAFRPLAQLGLGPGLIAAGITPDRFLSRAWDTGETVYELVLDAASEQRFNGPFLNIHRADLHDVLQSAVRPGSIVFNHRLAGLRQTADAVQLHFENGITAEADIVIGADESGPGCATSCWVPNRRASPAAWRSGRSSRRPGSPGRRSATAPNGGAPIVTSLPIS